MSQRGPDQLQPVVQKQTFSLIVLGKQAEVHQGFIGNACTCTTYGINSSFLILYSTGFIREKNSLY